MHTVEFAADVLSVAALGFFLFQRPAAAAANLARWKAGMGAVAVYHVLWVVEWVRPSWTPPANS